MFPNIHYFLHRPVLSNPPMARLCEILDGTYSINDLLLLHEMLDYKDEVMKRANEQQEQETNQLIQEYNNG